MYNLRFSLINKYLTNILFILIFVTNQSLAKDILHLKDFKQIIQFALTESEIIHNLDTQKHIDSFFYQSETDIYNSNLNIIYDRRDLENPVLSDYQVSEIKQDNYSLSLEQNLPYGIESVIKTDYAKTNSNAFSQNYKYDNSSLTLELKMDLLQNIFGRMDKSILAKALVQKKLQDFNIKYQKSEYLYQVGENTLSLLRAYDLISFQKSRCKNLQDLLLVNKKKYQQNLLEEADYLLIKVRYQECQAQLNKININSKILKDQLFYRLSPYKKDHHYIISLPTRNILPIFNINPKKDFKIEHNLNLAIAKFMIDKNYQTYQQAKFAKAADISLSSKISNQGQNIYHDNNSRYNINDYEYPSYEVNFNIKVPLGNKKNKALYHKANLEWKLQKQKYQTLKNQIQSEYQTILYEIEKNNLLSKQLKKEVVLRKKIFKQRKKDFILGRISTEDIITVQDDLTDSLQEYSGARFSMLFFQLKYLLLSAEISEYFK